MLSIIIPKTLNEEKYLNLIEDLGYQFEIIIACEQGDESDFPYKKSYSPRGRAQQMNAGAKIATGEFLWFVHADTRVSTKVLRELIDSLKSDPDLLHYFDLIFLSDGPGKMCINSFGVKLRSEILHMPFGDQALCISRTNFDSLGGFNESLEYGEDHDFVWRARIRGIELKNVGLPVYTSARKYSRQGWGTITLEHLKKTFYQAYPKYLEYLETRYN